MKYKNRKSRPTRSYRQTARAAAAEQTVRRIAVAFAECIHERWIEDVTLEDVAARAGVTVRTIIRRFGSKEGLLARHADHLAAQIREDMQITPGDIEGALDRGLRFYESMGDGIVRNLAQEKRYPVLKPMLERGRSELREILAQFYSPWLDAIPAKEQRRVLDQLVIATDIYAWQILRRDAGRSLNETRAVMLALIRAILAQLSATTRASEADDDSTSP
jgi:AcrR family transcriptional regulator